MVGGETSFAKPRKARSSPESLSANSNIDATAIFRVSASGILDMNEPIRKDTLCNFDIRFCWAIFTERIAHCVTTTESETFESRQTIRVADSSGIAGEL